MSRFGASESPLRFVGRLLLILFCLALIWYGLMAILLVAGVPAETVDLISGYRTAYDYLAGLGPDDVSGTVRAIIGVAGLLAFLLFGYLALKEIPRPYVARGDIVLGEDERGRLEVEPSAVEHMAEQAALAHPAVRSATGHLGEDLVAVDVEVARAQAVPETLREVRGQVREALGRHDLPPLPVNVTLTGFNPPQQRRELQ